MCTSVVRTRYGPIYDERFFFSPFFFTRSTLYVIILSYQTRHIGTCTTRTLLTRRYIMKYDVSCTDAFYRRRQSAYSNMREDVVGKKKKKIEKQE